MTCWLHNRREQNSLLFGICIFYAKTLQSGTHEAAIDLLSRGAVCTSIVFQNPLPTSSVAFGIVLLLTDRSTHPPREEEVDNTEQCRNNQTKIYWRGPSKDICQFSKELHFNPTESLMSERTLCPWEGNANSELFAKYLFHLQKFCTTRP